MDPAKINLEEEYNSTLAHMFLKKVLSGIPTNPFSRAIDKFNMILLESHDNGGIIKLNFIHLSYHEAFWYAVKKDLSLARWWKLIKESILDITRRIDLVQLGMIERYGTINRDLNQVLLIYAESDNLDERMISLMHMSKKLSEFVNLPQFFNIIN
jgi:hypothetical protein